MLSRTEEKRQEIKAQFDKAYAKFADLIKESDDKLRDRLICAIAEYAQDIAGKGGYIFVCDNCGVETGPENDSFWLEREAQQEGCAIGLREGLKAKVDLCKMCSTEFLGTAGKGEI